MGMSHPAWGAWIEMKKGVDWPFGLWSHPAWGAWIEIRETYGDALPEFVAPRMGCVD